jgi:mannose-1-phosphate guanylyltransferase
MIAILLIGGMGTRLRPLTLTQPKALLPVLNRPFITYQLDLLKKSGVKRVVFSSGKHMKMWEHSFRRLASRDFKLDFAYERTPLGTAGGIRFAYDIFHRRHGPSDESVLVFNGDVLFDLDVEKFEQFHRKHHASASIALTRVADPSKFGVIKMNTAGQVRTFLEKPKHMRGPAWINAGAYLLNSSWVGNIPSKKLISIEREIFPCSLANGDVICGFPLKGYWNDIGTPVNFLEVQRALVTQNTCWTHVQNLRKRGLHVFPDGKKGNKPTVRGWAFMESGAVIGKDVILEGVVCCGRNVSLGDGSRVRDSVVMEGAKLENGVHVRGAIVGRRCRIGANTNLGEGAMLGDKTVLPPYTRCGQ